jgi:hypothetical protein
VDSLDVTVVCRCDRGFSRDQGICRWVFRALSYSLVLDPPGDPSKVAALEERAAKFLTEAAALRKKVHTHSSHESML